jgi:hypothetical protein
VAGEESNLIALVNVTCQNQYLWPWTYVEFLGMTRFVTVLIGKVGGLYGIPSLREKVPSMNLICPSQNEVRWIPLVNTAKESQVPKKVDKFGSAGPLLAFG